MIKRILLKFLGIEPHKFNKGAMQDWLNESYENDGFKNYHSFRKKNIQETMGMGLKQQDYWESVGRIKEIMELKSNIGFEVMRRKTILKKKERVDVSP